MTTTWHENRPRARALKAGAARAGRVATGLAAQRLLRRDRRRVVYNSFYGRFADSPRAIYEELLRRGDTRAHAWVADRGGEPFPSDVRRVTTQTPAYFRELGRACYVVSNVQMPNNFVKRPGVTYLQTWHGTPLKRIGFDNQRWDQDPEGLKRMARDFQKWDYLVSQNAFSTEIFRRTFQFEGEVLETGYPRNDALNAPDRDAVRQRVRRALGIEDGQTAVLYAPTWRENAVDASGNLQFSLELDVERFARELGESHVLLLRLHYLLAASLADSLGTRALNVSDHADIRELYLAADVLVTDYSSAMFDYAVTGKPMMFFTYDLDEYASERGGFYFDLGAEAPGPLCSTTEELVAALSDATAVNAAHDDRYARFRERFCPHDDGKAASRVVDRVWGTS